MTVSEAGERAVSVIEAYGFECTETRHGIASVYNVRFSRPDGESYWVGTYDTMRDAESVVNALRFVRGMMACDVRYLTRK